MKAFMILPVSGGVPDLGDLEYYGYVLCDIIDDFGAYMISGTEIQIDNIHNLSNTIRIAHWNEDANGKNKEAQLNKPIAGNVRRNLNDLLVPKGFESLPDGHNGKDSVNSTYSFFNDYFDINVFDVAGTGD